MTAAWACTRPRPTPNSGLPSAAGPERDARQRRLLEDAGWQVLTVWECELKDSSALESELVRFLETGR